MKPCRPSLVAALVLAFLAVPCAAAAQTFAHEYAVKVLCMQLNAEGVLAPGAYGTVVNVHNPSGRTTSFRFKVVIAGFPTSGVISSFRTIQISPDGAIVINCHEIRERLRSASGSIDGFVVIQSAIDLDVVAVYSAAPSGGGVSTMDIERYTARRIQ